MQPRNNTIQLWMQLCKLGCHLAQQVQGQGSAGLLEDLARLANRYNVAIYLEAYQDRKTNKGSARHSRA